jgi:hypothetical protein
VTFVSKTVVRFLAPLVTSLWRPSGTDRTPSVKGGYEGYESAVPNPCGCLVPRPLLSW